MPQQPLDELHVQTCLERSLVALVRGDSHLLKTNNNERCIVGRLAIHLQPLVPEWSVDIEYGRVGTNRTEPKRLGLPATCANRVDLHGLSYVVPDLIVHERGATGTNLLVVEVKKSSNPVGQECDRLRIRAFMARYKYHFAAVIEVETRAGREASAHVSEWLTRQP